MASAVPEVDVQVVTALPAGVPGEIEALLTAVAREDGVRPFSEQSLLRLRPGSGSAGDTAVAGGPLVRHVLARDGGRLVGYAQVELAAGDPAGASAELAVATAHRGRGIGGALVRAVLAEVPAGPVRLWAHGGGAPDERGPAARLALRFGFRRTRSLLQLRRPLTDAAMPLPELAVPEGIRIRPFVVGRDEPAWLAVNRAAFAGHPEQGRWTADDLRQREGEPWFDPAGFLLAEQGPVGGGRLVGFHWTKVHPHDVDGPADTRDRPIGEVYVVGVAPDMAGHGLGRVLTLAGLLHLRDRGLEAVLLYVDADNAAALRTYERLGFRPYTTDVQYSREL